MQRRRNTMTMDRIYEVLCTISAEQWNAISELASEIATEKTEISNLTDFITKKQCQQGQDPIKRISNLLKSLGMSTRIKGYRYVRYAIFLTYNDFKYVENVTKGLYPTVAKEFNTTSSSVERTIRHAIESTWRRPDIERLTKELNWNCRSKKGKPTNSEFISFMADYLHNNN